MVCAPGNAGIAQLARCVPANQKDLNDLLRVVSAESPDLVVVGPELPLSMGLVDELKRRSIAAFGPTQKAAQLESSKAFAKRFMQRHKIPTANYAVCNTKDEALESLHLFHLPAVIKADGLASGKGVLICQTKREAEEAIAGLFSGKLLGSAVGNQTWFPAWQFDADRLRPDLPRILELLGLFTSDPLAADRVMRLTHDELGGASIAEALRRPKTADTAWRMLAAVGA